MEGFKESGRITRESIATALLLLMEEKDYEKITISEITEKVNKIVQDYMPAADEPSRMVAEAMSYAMSSGGKRIRPLPRLPPRRRTRGRSP